MYFKLIDDRKKKQKSNNNSICRNRIRSYMNIIIRINLNIVFEEKEIEKLRLSDKDIIV